MIEVILATLLITFAIAMLVAIKKYKSKVHSSYISRICSGTTTYSKHSKWRYNINKIIYVPNAILDIQWLYNFKMEEVNEVCNSRQR